MCKCLKKVQCFCSRCVHLLQSPFFLDHMNNLFSLLFYVNVGAPWGVEEGTLQEVEEASYEVIKLQVKRPDVLECQFSYYVMSVSTPSVNFYKILTLVI